MDLTPCPTCNRHIRTDEPCPFCRPRPRKAGAAAIIAGAAGLSVALLGGCSDKGKSPDGETKTEVKTDQKTEADQKTEEGKTQEKTRPDDDVIALYGAPPEDDE